MKVKFLIKNIIGEKLFRGRHCRQLAFLNNSRAAATALAIFATMTVLAYQTTALPARSFLQTATPSPAAQTKPNIADEVEKEPAKQNDPPRQTSPRRRGANNGGYNGSGAGNRQPAYGSLLEVTFTTDVAEAEIFLNRGGLRTQKLGNTDANGKLTYRLARGRHSIAASRIGLPIQRQDIDVQSGNTSFTFKLSPATTEAAGNADAPASTKDKDSDSTTKGSTPASDDAAAVAATANSHSAPDASADDLLNRYLDPKENNLTASDWERVQAQAKAGLEKEPDNAQLKAQSLLAQGQLAYLRKDYPSALVVLNKASLQPATLEAPVNYALGNAYLATNQSIQAIKAFRRAIEAKQDLSVAYKGIGDAYTQQGKSKDAANSYEQARKFGGGNNSTGNNGSSAAAVDNSSAGSGNLSAAHALMKSGRWSQALKELIDVSKSQPSVDVYTNIGDCYYELKQPLSASQAYLKATELDPKSALAFYKHGIVMFEQREYAQAMESMERALALDQTGSNINRGKARDIANKSEKKVRKQS